MNTVLQKETKTDDSDEPPSDAEEMEEDEKDESEGEDILPKAAKRKAWSLRKQLKELELYSTQVQDNLIKPTANLGDMVSPSSALASHII